MNKKAIIGILGGISGLGFITLLCGVSYQKGRIDMAHFIADGFRDAYIKHLVKTNNKES